MPVSASLPTLGRANELRPSRGGDGSGRLNGSLRVRFIWFTRRRVQKLSKEQDMLKTLILGTTAIATLVTPAVAGAQSYSYDNAYHHHHHRNRAGAAIAAAVVGSVLGYAVGSSRGYGYSQPSYGYGNYGYRPGYNYGYQPGYSYGYQPAYNYGYPGYGYTNSYAYPGYGYDGGYRYDRDDDDD